MRHFVGRLADCGDKRVWRSGFIAFCIGTPVLLGRKSFDRHAFHLVSVTGGPISGDIIRWFCLIWFGMDVLTQWSLRSRRYEHR